jgi:cation diffusion facilitator family transporter
MLILLASVAIGWTAVERLLAPHPLEAVGMGLVVSTAASLVNFGVARVLLRASEANNSIALEADARHLLTDVWTSVGVVIAVGAVELTGWAILDPLIAILVAMNILWVAYGLVHRSVSGLLDRALSPRAVDAIRAVLEKYRLEGADYHALRTREAAGRSFVAVHVLVPPTWTVQRGHSLLEAVERDIRAAVPGTTVMTHLEPIGDPASYADIELDRGEGGEVCLLRNGRSQIGR